MTKRKRYFISQILFIPFVILPSVVGGVLCAIALNVHDLIAGWLVFPVVSALLINWMRRPVGILLELLRLLPSGARQAYPCARSWNEYERGSS
jgi:ABC-type sulfate transport system permease component